MSGEGDIGYAGIVTGCLVKPLAKKENESALICFQIDKYYMVGYQVNVPDLVYLPDEEVREEACSIEGYE